MEFVYPGCLHEVASVTLAIDEMLFSWSKHLINAHQRGGLFVNASIHLLSHSAAIIHKKSLVFFQVLFLIGLRVFLLNFKFNVSQRISFMGYTLSPSSIELSPPIYAILSTCIFEGNIIIWIFTPTFKCIFYDIFYVTFYFVKTKVTPKKAPRHSDSHGAGWWTPIFQWAPMHDASLKLPSSMSVFIYYLLPLTVLNVAHYLLQSGTVLRDE